MTRATAKRGAAILGAVLSLAALGSAQVTVADQPTPYKMTQPIARVAVLPARRWGGAAGATGAKGRRWAGGNQRQRRKHWRQNPHKRAFS